MADIMMPVLYKAEETAFETDGLGVLCDAVSCLVTEERNGIFELTMEYPIDGQHYGELRNDRIIRAKPNETDAHQPFRIYRVSRPMNGIVTVEAEHISYKLNAIPVAGFRASGNAQSALDALLRAAVLPTGFTAVSDISASASTEILEPCSVRSCLGGREGSILDRWGGEYRFDNFLIELRAHRGRASGVVIEYGKNLTDVAQEESIDTMYTAVMPYARKTVNDTEHFFYIPERYIAAESAGAFAFPRICPVDFSEKFGDEETPADDRLRELARAYIENNAVGVPKVSIKVSFVPLWQTEEYRNVAPLERVNLCDTATVRYPRLGVDATAKVIKTVYDVLKGRYQSMELGEARSKFTDSVKNLQQEIEQVDKKFGGVPSMVTGVIEHATGLITGANGGHVVIKTDADGKPQEILIMDTDRIETALKVWRWNINGLGYSQNGINGPYETAITMDGHILGKFISALTIVGGQIVAGKIQSVKGNVYFDLEANGGQGEIAASTLIAPSNAHNTNAHIGTITDSYGAASEALTFTTTANKGGRLLVSVDREGRASDRKYPLANTTRLDSDGDLELRSNAKSGENSWGAILEMRERSDGRVIASLEAGTKTGSYAEVNLDSNGTADIYCGEDAYFSGGVSADVSGGSSSITLDDNGIQTVGDLYADGHLVTSDPDKKQDVETYGLTALQQIERANVYRYQLIQPVAARSKHNNAVKQKNGYLKKRQRLGIMYNEAPEEIRHELPDGRKCVDLYGMCSLLWKAVQELGRQIEEMKKRGARP